MATRKLVVGITGASGVIYGIYLLKEAKQYGLETHLIISDTARRIIEFETSFSVDQIETLASFVYSPNDLFAPVASGSFKTDAMIIAPCSIKTLSSVANSYSSSLITRAADVALKEKRRLVLCVRETPFHCGHLKLMLQASDAGAIISPPCPSFYSKPDSLDEIVKQSVGKLLDLVGIDTVLYKRWSGASDLHEYEY
ncbi:UbiX family flavin prenyltransferase [Chitinispirillales bacterium ANBcel5]|uniref:UbiX family flavin prenyltransferase n=1 Tax=Cellulosispirillum alkaliphilum TaxID=3039283 RepID=UPI002A577893|nr:UbiX family flavin prenyltransferase [Chitinispirillales bacterium ANBcel5]